MNRAFTLARRPRGRPVAVDFALVDRPIPTPGPGEILIRNRYASLDPAMRGWLDDVPSYMPPVAIGAPVRASTIGEVVASRLDGFAPGDWVLGLNALEHHSLVQAGGFTQKIDPAAVPSVTNYLSIFGAVGLTAYFGLLDVGRPRPGETVLVSGAAGAVGSLVGQIAKIHGCRAVGIAGGPEKARRLTERYGYDTGIDYRGKHADQLAADIRAAAPDGVDVVFENTGGPALDAALSCLNRGARIALCGLISEYNSEAVGARNLWQLIARSARIEGFLVLDYLPRFPEGAAAMAGWLSAGRLRFDEHIDKGLDNAFTAFSRLFDGTNDGKLILKL